MYSDDWIHAGYKKLNKVWMNEVLNYYYWQKPSGELAGITLNFEHADDVHIEICYHDWVDFLSKELRLGQEMCNLNSAEYLKNITWNELEEQLRFHGITYKIIHF